MGQRLFYGKFLTGKMGGLLEVMVLHKVLAFEIDKFGKVWGGVVYLLQNSVVMKKFIIVVFLSVFPVLSYAQFYDDEDELYFYDYAGDESANKARVFNFDGKKGAQLNNGTRLSIVNNLKDDINYFEKQVFKVDFNLKYVGKTSNGMTEYVEREYFPYTGNVLITHYYFSADRKKLVTKCESDHFSIEYHKVEKSAFLPGRSRRSLSENDVIYD